MYWVGQKVRYVFSIQWLVLLSLASFETILLDCIVTAVISTCIFLKKRVIIREFLCSHCNIEDGRKYTTFSACYALLFQESKNATETQRKDLSSVWRRCRD